jgi:hypothetical protein
VLLLVVIRLSLQINTENGSEDVSDKNVGQDNGPQIFQKNVRFTSKF